jgi:hypothetical protein
MIHDGHQSPMTEASMSVQLGNTTLRGGSMTVLVQILGFQDQNQFIMAFSLRHGLVI